MATNADTALGRGLLVIIVRHLIGRPAGWMQVDEWGERKDSFDINSDRACSFLEAFAQQFDKDGGTDFAGSTAQAYGIPLLRDFIMCHGMQHKARCFRADWASPLLEKDWRMPNEFGRVVYDHVESNTRRHVFF